MFKPHRIFAQHNPNTGMMEWFFNAREGIFGPYTSKDAAAIALDDFVLARSNAGEDGGRSKEAKADEGLSLAPMEHPPVYDPLRKRRDRE